MNPTRIRKKFHILHRASQGRPGTKGDRVQPVTTLYICKTLIATL